MAPLTPEHAGEIISELVPAIDACRAILLEPQQSRNWLKDTPDGRRETVSELDLLVQDTLLAAIREIVPTASILSEEAAHDPATLDDDVCLVIDPVDGTDLLLSGQSGFAISVAVAATHRILAGVLDFPARDQRFTCTLGSGALLNGRRIKLADASTLESARVAVSSTQRNTPSLQVLWSELLVADLVPTPGFTAKIANVLTGECDAAVYLPIDARPTFIWDYAASALLLREAGARLTTLNGQPFLATLPMEQRQGWLAATELIYPSIRAALTTALRRHSKVDG